MYKVSLSNIYVKKHPFETIYKIYGQFALQNDGQTRT
jgi:hypothetical protein